MENLRGTKGASFEGRGKITRGAEGAVGCGCCAGSSDDGDHKERFLLIKGPFCFVFSNEEAPSPKYAVGLQCMRANVKQQSATGHIRGGRVTVWLENHLGDLQYEFSFENEDIANQFKSAVEKEAASAQVEAVRKRLGHENLITKRASIMFAENIAKEKESEQPDAPVTTKEIIENMPLEAM